jgi:TolB protein
MAVRGVALVSLVLGSLVSISAPAAATFPGDNGRLVFEREAPAGDHTQADLYAIRADGSHLDRLTATPNKNEFGPAWNAAGTRVAFWRTKAPFGPGSIWVMDADGGHQHRLTRGFDARDPAWNPAGTRLVFTRIVGSNFDLWTMRASDGGDLRQLTSGPALDFEPAWSPSGGEIAFTRGHEQGDVGDIFVINLRSNGLSHVTRTQAYDHQVGWAPDGTQLVFERDYDTLSSIFTVDVTTGHVVRRTHGPFFDTGPAFSPNGRLIAFGSDRGGNDLADLWLMSKVGARLHAVLHLRYSEGFPDWRPIPR